MALERRIAVAALVVGLAIVVVALFGCGGDEGEPLVSTCDDRDFAMQVAGARVIGGGDGIRIAYAGAAPCKFAVDRHMGTLYVELRSGTSHDNMVPFPSGCVEGELDVPVGSETPIERMSIGKDLLDDARVERLLAGEEACAEVPRGQAAFIID